MKKLRVFWSSNAPFSQSGYGQQMAELLPKFVQAGYPTAISCFYGLEGGIIELNGIRCYPKMGDPYGSDAMVEHPKHFQADVVFTLQDIWVLNPQLLQQVKRWVPVVPIDHDPVPPAVFERLKMANRVITYAPYGQRELYRNGMHSTYIPHTVDTNLFAPSDKKAAKKELSIPEDAFLFGMVSANKDNPPRKGFQQAMDAFKIFLQKHPNARMYFHTLLEQAGGFNIKEYAHVIGIQDHIFHLHPYVQLFGIGKTEMSRIYNAFDCLLAPSTNEGFGVPIIEAQSCGVPVITSNFTAMADLIIDGKTGYFVQEESRRFTPIGSYIANPSVQSIYENMERVFAADREKMGRSARRFIQKNFDTEKIFKTKWLPYLEMLEKEIYPESK